MPAILLPRKSLMFQIFNSLSRAPTSPNEKRISWEGTKIRSLVSPGQRTDIDQSAG